jgi:hypothetical protein
LSLSALFARPQHPSAKRMTTSPVPGRVPSPSLGDASSSGLSAFSRLHRQDASIPLLQPTFRVTSTREQHPFWRLPVRHRGKTRRRQTSRDVSDPRHFCLICGVRAALNHLAVIQPPTAACLTARCRLQVDWPPRACLLALCGGEHRCLFSFAVARPNRAF